MSEKGTLPNPLMWLADAPLFIDEDQVRRFYDAVVRPAGKEGTIKLEVSEKKITEISGKLGIAGEISLPSFLSALLTLKGKLTAEVGGKKGGEKSTTTAIELTPIDTPQRQLEDLAVHYLIKHTERIHLVDDPSIEVWREQKFISSVPRALAFINLPGQAEAAQRTLPETKLIPTAVEFENGITELLFSKLTSPDGCPPPKYPDTNNVKGIGTLLADRAIYWKWFDENYNATKAMIAVEEASSRNGRIRWIDFRVPVNRDGSTLHLHIAPSGKYDTGVFGYNFIKRGFKHGLRLVGTLKSEPDMNVLAIYEK